MGIYAKASQSSAKKKRCKTKLKETVYLGPRMEKKTAQKFMCTCYYDEVIEQHILQKVSNLVHICRYHIQSIQF